MPQQLMKKLKMIPLNPFFTLGSGWDQPHRDNLGGLVGLAEPNAEIIIVNPDDEIKSVSLKLVVEPISGTNHVTIQTTNEILFEIILFGQNSILVENIDLLPGENIILIKSSEFTILPASSEAEFERKISLIVDSITLV